MSSEMTRENIRTANRLRVLNLIREKSPVSRTELSRLTKIRPATLNLLLNELEGQQLIINGSVLATNHAGRKPRGISLHKEGRMSLGVHFGEISLYLVASNLEGKIFFEAKEDIEHIENKEDLLHKICYGIDSLLKVENVHRKKVLGLGLGIPGLIDLQHGTSLFYDFYPWWRQIPLKSILEEKFSIPVIVDNDTRTLTISEKVYGQGKSVKNFLFLELGILGVGLGIVLNGEVYYGKSGKAGEAGHITIDEEGPLCTCGNYGCLEALCSGKALEKSAERFITQGVITRLTEEKDLTYKTIIKSAKKGDKASLQIVENMGQHLGAGVAALINIFNPELVILGGRLSKEAGELFLPIVERQVKLRALPELRDDVLITVSRMEENSGALGAATLILEKFFKGKTV